MHSRASGATVPHLNVEDIREIDVTALPDDREQQRQAGAILGAIDDLIETNQRRVALLEQIAQAIYREWFVHFRYPGHEDDELVDSPLGPIPTGWSLTPLGELGPAMSESVDPSEVDPGTPSVGLEHIPRRSFTLSEWGSASDLTSRKNRFAAGDVLFGKIRPYFHKVCVAPVDGIASTDAIVVRPVRDARGLVTMTMFSDDFVAHAVATSNGTKMPRADWKVLREWLVPIPPNTTLSAFETAVASAVDSCNLLAFQSRTLAELRDLLLPKLVSGDIDVSHLDLDALLEASAT
jgi:type I restriction enzyme S subunit